MWFECSKVLPNLEGPFEWPHHMCLLRKKSECIFIWKPSMGSCLAVRQYNNTIFIILIHVQSFVCHYSLLWDIIFLTPYVLCNCILIISNKHRYEL